MTLSLLHLLMSWFEDPSHTQLSKEGLGKEIPRAKLNSRLKNLFLSIAPEEREREITERGEQSNTKRKRERKGE